MLIAQTRGAEWKLILGVDAKRELVEDALYRRWH
jgi:hypothetical protein